MLSSMYKAHHSWKNQKSIQLTHTRIYLIYIFAPNTGVNENVDCRNPLIQQIRIVNFLSEKKFTWPLATW